MKKLFFYAMSLAAMMGTFTSCDWDQDNTKGMVLSGCWEGDFSMCYDYEYHGRYYTVDAEYTDIQFYPYSDCYDQGYGYQVDIYYDGPWEEVYHSFTWEVRNGIIYLDYCSSGEEELTTYLRDYNMTNDYLTGYFGSTSSRFSLRKYKDYYNWTPYINTYGDYNYGYGYGYSYNDDWYYAPTRSAGDSQDVAAEAPKLIRVYNRHAAK